MVADKSLKKLLLFLFLLIIVFAVFIRFYKLGQIPNGLASDEADLGYNAFSIIKTGKDVYGRPFPLFFQALDDYKPGLVFYSSIPAILLFGLSDFSIRVAPAIFGSLTIILFYFLTKLLYPKEKFLPFFSALLIVFAPWHIALSRAMVWYSELLFFYCLSFVLLLFSFHKHRRLVIFAVFILGLTVYIYYAAIIYLPFILAICAFLYRENLLRNLRLTILAFFILLVTFFPALIHYKSSNSKTRFNAISVLTGDITLPASIAEIEYDKTQNFPFPQIIHNRRLVYLSAMIDNYFDYFNLDYLFATAKNTRYFYVNGVGLFYLVELPFFLYGMYLIFKRRQKSDILVLSLLLIGPIPAMITLGSPFPHRALLTIFSIQLISAIGIATFISNILRANGKFSPALPARTVIMLLSVIYGASIYFFLHQYFVHSPREFISEIDNGAWYSTVREAIPIVNQYKDKYGTVVFTWSVQKLVPAVYFLFYNQIDPRILQSKAALWTNEPPSYKQIYDKIDNVEFRKINWEQDKNLKNTLLIGYQNEFPLDIEVIDKTYLPNNNPHFLFVETQ